MSIELGAAEEVVREQAARAGMSVERWVLRLAAEHPAREHLTWHERHPGVLDAARATIGTESPRAPRPHRRRRCASRRCCDAGAADRDELEAVEIALRAAQGL